MKLEVRDVAKSFGAHVALAGATLCADDARCLVLIGPSGGGKSTLLRLIAGLDVPDRGAIRLAGADVPCEGAALLSHRRSLGVVFQSFNLFPHLTALRNITLPLIEVHGRAPAEAEARALELLKRFQLDGHAGKKPAELSGGQRQRVAIVRAVAAQPRLLLFDEPTSALDPEMTAEVLDMIGGLREAGQDLVLVTHQLAFARRVADRVALLADGRVAEDAPAAAFFEAPRTDVARRFLDRVLRY